MKNIVLVLCGHSMPHPWANRINYRVVASSHYLLSLPLSSLLSSSVLLVTGLTAALAKKFSALCGDTNLCLLGCSVGGDIHVAFFWFVGARLPLR